MFRLLLVSTLLVCALTSPVTTKRKPRVPMPDGRIVGGWNCNIEEHPYVVSLLWQGSHICGGSIIAPLYVVTAAHCTDIGVPTQYSVRAGSSIRNSGGVVIQVAIVHQHPQYDDWTIDNDISVLVLATPLTFGPGIGAIGLPQQSQPIPVGVDAIVTGWGTTSEGGSPANVLQCVIVKTISLEECRLANGWDDVTERMMCAGVPEGGKDACQGDSGGPLVIGSELIGIVSWGWGCARPNLPGVYASVPALRYFIEQSVGV